MSEKMFQYIKVGGRLDVANLIMLLGAMSADGVINVPASELSIQEKLSLIDDNVRGDWLWLETICQDESPFKNVETFCNEYGLAYDRHVVSEWSYSGNVHQHRPGEPDCVKITSSVTSESMTPEDEDRIVHLLDSGDAEEAMKTYDKAVDSPAATVLPPFKVV